MQYAVPLWYPERLPAEPSLKKLIAKPKRQELPPASKANLHNAHPEKNLTISHSSL